MSLQHDFLLTRLRRHHYLPDPSSTQRASSSTWTPHSRIYSSNSLPTYRYSSQADLHNADLLAPLSDTTLDSDSDQRSTSSATLLSQPDFAARPSGSCRSCSLYSLREPGQMTAQRAQRLRARIASVIMSIPATCEDVVDIDGHGPRKSVEVPASKLRRVSGVKDLRRAFREGDHGPARSISISSLRLSKASYEFGILAAPTPSLSNLTPRSSLRTLVDLGSALSKSTGDLKTLRGSTLSSVSIASRLVTKVHSVFSPRRSSHTWSHTAPPLPVFHDKQLVHNSSIPRSHHRKSLYLDTRPPQFPGESVWSCAKISQSTVKLAARRGHTPRRVFSSPIAVLSS